MILSDNETSIDLLNYEAIAKTVVSLIKESDDQPVSIGIHGDWGAGKSSVLKMIEEQLENESKPLGKKYSCIRFNGWKHQGFEDSKIAIMSAIVSELTEKEKLTEKAKDVLEKLWKNINWMAVAKAAGKTAFGLATGTAPLAILSSTLDLLKVKGGTEEGVTSAIESIGGYLKDANITEDTSSNTEFVEFQKNFKELLEKANIEKLVVLIDDLDRCLPEVAIGILEAIRLFMFTGETAFVIAADESMIRYAVKKHFPDMIDENRYNFGKDFSDKYLEKLIQVPFKIPALGEVEACNYIMLLLAGSRLDKGCKGYEQLCNDGINRLKAPWSAKKFTVAEVQTLLGTDYEKVQNEVLIATQVCNLLSSNTDGNPRKIKRFINMLLLRAEIAKNRGYGDAINLEVLAKMMLAENYAQDFYKALPSKLNSDGVWAEYPKVIEAIKKAIETPETPVEIEDKWFDLNLMKDWLLSAPDIAGIDLRPYYYACKEKTDYFAGRVDKNDLTAIIDVLFSSDMTIMQHVEEIKGLSNPDANQVFEIVAQKIMEKGSFEQKPAGIDGLIILTEHKESLCGKLIAFIEGLPKDKVGVWVLSGWDKAIRKESEEANKLERYFENLKENGNKFVKAALRSMKES